MIVEIIKSGFTIIGVITTIIGLYELYKKYRDWKQNQSELKREIGLLESAEYFVAHVIHLGGEFSMINSVQVYSDEEGGYYFNPPKDFVSVGFNRGGDLTIVTPSELSRKYGFIIESIAGSDRVFEKNSYSDICHLPQTSLRNEHFIRFTKIST